MVKTSLTHPLEILAVQVPGGGRIGMALCPGKRQPHAATGPWNRDLAIDMAAIHAFGAALLVTLMEPLELVQAEVPVEVMRTSAASRGIDWLHLPITDFQAPGAEFEAAWPRHSAAICDLLKRKRNVVVHCRGGRGRSGMIAARLLLEFGFSANDAIKSIRAVNPLAMETIAQEDYIRSNARDR
jgi:ADP-ribosyl-[dinitrogen reductase] hydrolase